MSVNTLVASSATSARQKRAHREPRERTRRRHDRESRQIEVAVDISSDEGSGDNESDLHVAGVGERGGVVGSFKRNSFVPDFEQIELDERVGVGCD